MPPPRRNSPAEYTAVIDLSWLFHLASLFPLDGMDMRFMQQALLALLFLTPMTAMLGVENVNYRIAYYSDAIRHSAFAGAGLGLILSIEPHLAMPVFGVLVGLSIVALKRRTSISSDVAIGVVFSAVVAFGLAVVSRSPGVARDMQQFLFGDILTISAQEIYFLMGLLPVMLVFQIAGYNSLYLIALNPVMARAQGVHVAFWQYLFSAMLAVIVIFSVWAVGVLLVTALLIVPRNLAGSARAMFWWSILISVLSAVIGLLLSAQPWLGTSSGATIILTACVFFALTTLPGVCRRERRG